ncbi:MAG: hypothetical protein SO072_03545 [Dysosmobacter sp.]|nr:hypothetical protein [Dysosmobacter sp.]
MRQLGKIQATFSGRVVALAIALLLLLSGCGKAKEDVTFPCLLADEQLSVTSLFQYSGENPDCGDEAGENIASLAVTNQSGRHLTSAKITAKLADGTRLTFQLADIPAGQTVWVFDQDNGSFASSSACKELKCEASFEAETPLLEDQVAVETEGTSVTLTNLTDEDLAGLTVYCHCLFDGTYFGGLTYAYPVDGIPAGESVTIQAEECYLGEAAVVRVTRNS